MSHDAGHPTFVAFYVAAVIVLGHYFLVVKPPYEYIADASVLVAMAGAVVEVTFRFA
ncbi:MULTISPECIES: hypothetical protein [unclassified Haladaptatus]|uniref:hypothetical protein n=1 Tax=unclassified Haladaptatus TaxID=2622732 RepID=UPI00209BDDD3|nr:MULTISPECIES: hypothetical protein [unclassified Haladaptatus]MCO8245136.1 hypothetical protein [Haladaptatus sp. AB643]MCO8253279.1 hypothetical protein [Haladaptatus sp. AB618]